MTREQVLAQLKGHPGFSQYEQLELTDLRIRLARERMKLLAQQRAKTRQPPQ